MSAPSTISACAYRQLPGLLAFRPVTRLRHSLYLARQLPHLGAAYEMGKMAGFCAFWSGN